MADTQVFQALAFVGTASWIIFMKKEMHLILEELTSELWTLIKSTVFVFVKLNTPTHTEGILSLQHRESVTHVV